MKALVKAEAKPGLWMRDVDEPVCGYNDVKIKINKTAICGTDLHIYNWDKWAQGVIKPPVTIGHEFAGKVVEKGDGVYGIDLGQRVSGEGHITCGQCRNCRAGRRHLCRQTVGVGVNRNGCFAEYLVIPAVNAFPLPDDISDDLGSILDPFGNATHTALSFDLVGEDVLITGAGPIGVMAAALSRHVGARFVVVTDVNDYRLGLAAGLGATRTLNPAKGDLKQVQKDLGMREGFDIGLEMSGVPSAFQSMLENMNHGGRIGMLGIFKDHLTVDSSLIIFKGLTIKGIYGREMFETWYKMASVLQSGLDISPIITHRYPVDDFIEGFEKVKSGRSGKVILDWD